MAEEPQVPIAVIGIGCRFSGGAHSPAELWEMLSEGRSGHGEVPEDRWNWKSFYHPHLEAKEALNSKHGYFLQQDIAAFDAALFNIPLYEADSMDPQQRILMEVTYEALENAGQTLENIKGTDTSVHMACYARDYDRMAWKDIPHLHKAHMTGSGEAILSNRISYLFDLKGASMTIDTGCSGSTVGLHLACQGLRTRESRMAIVGGTQLLLTPDQSIQMSMVGMVNPDGRCYVFDDRGSGYARGDGVATLVLKRLDDAIADGDSVHAVIRASGLNQDGRTAGISLPNPTAQSDLMRAVYKKAGLNPLDTPYVEAHGTGTQAGDNAEVSSIARVFTNDGARTDTLLIGSIKGNIGHLEASSGMSGLIKCILVLKHSMIPPNIDLITPKKNLRLEERNLKVVQEMTPLPSNGLKLKRVSVNSFGYGGTNAHVILEEAPALCRSPEFVTRQNHVYTEPSSEINGVHKLNGFHATTIHGEISGVNGFSDNSHEKNGVNGTNGSIAPNIAPEVDEKHDNKRVWTNGVAAIEVPTPHLIVLTAKAEVSLRAAGARLLNWTSSHSAGDYLADLSFTLATRRTTWNYRSTFVASTHEELASALTEKALRVTRTWMNTPVVFMFTGQGAQWYAMGRELLPIHSAFHDSFVKSDEILKALGAEWSLIDELLKDENSSRIGKSEVAQPACTALQIALVDLLLSLGIVPQAVVGHSSGEIAAAYAAGALTHQAALEVSYRRGFLSEAIKQISSSKGAMMAVGLGEDEVMDFITQIKSGLCCVACVNSPGSTTISGDEAAIDELKVLLDAQSVFNRKLKVDTAYHSHHMRKVADRYLSSIEHVQATAPHASIKFFSSVTGVEKTSGFGPSYWVQNLISKVRFSDALGNLCNSSLRVPGAESGALKHTLHLLLELGPHSALAGPSRQTISGLAKDKFQYHYASCLVRGHHALASILSMAGKVFEFGQKVNMKTVVSLSGPETRPIINDLAPYPWNHEVTFWYESYLSRDHRMRKHPNHDLLGLRVVSSTIHEPMWRNVLSIETLPWLRDHVVDGFIIVPGAYYVTMAIEAIRQICVDRQVVGVLSNILIRNISFSKALIVQDHHQTGFYPTVDIQLTLRPLKTLLSDKHGWEQFRILSRSDDGAWNEHCSGQILAQFSSKVDEVEGNRETEHTSAMQLAALKRITQSCTINIKKDELYKELDSGGNSFGPAFAHVREASLGKDGESLIGVTDLIIPDIAASMPGGWQQPHLIHPIVFDQFFHTAIPLYRRNFNPGALMPTSIGEFSVSVDFPSTAGEKLIYTTRMVSDGSRSAVAECVIFKENEDLSLTKVCEFNESTLRIVGEEKDDIQDETSPFHRKHSYNIIWDIDLDHISPKSLKVEDAANSSLAVTYLHLLCFKKPHMKILQIDGGTGEMTRPLLKCLSRREGLLMDRFHFTSTSASGFEQAKVNLQDWTDHIDYKTLDISQDPVSQGFVEASYDLIIASDTIQGASSLDTTATHIRALLKAGGRLIIIKSPKFVPIEDNSDSETGILVENSRDECLVLSENQWHGVLSTSGFDGAVLVEDPMGVSSIVVSKAIDAARLELDTQSEVEILYTTQSPIAQVLISELSSSLRRLGLNVSTTTWTSHININSSTIYVVIDDLQHPLLADPTDEQYHQVMNLLVSGKSIMWISTQDDCTSATNPSKGMITGLARVARKETGAKIVTVDIQQSIVGHRSKLVEALSRTVVNTFTLSSETARSTEYEISYKDNQILIPRISTDTKFNDWVDEGKSNRQLESGIYKQHSRPLKIHVGTPGILSSLHFIDDERAHSPLQPDELEISAMAYGVNFKEVFIAMGQMKPNVRMPAECAGIVTAVGSNLSHQYKIGDRVCGRDGSPFASFARCKGFTCARMPDSMSFAEGASISVIFGTSHYCLMDIARLQKGQKILIHAASGGVGQSAIQFAQLVGAEIYATCGSTAKRQLLTSIYGIPEDHIFSTRQRTFKQGILRMTGGRGVDVVLNSLAGEYLQDSLAVVAPLGTFIEIGKADIYKKSGLGMAPFDRNIAFQAVDMTVLDKIRPEQQQERFSKVMKMFERGELKPVSPITEISMTNIEEAFRLIQAHKHAGKIVMVADEHTMVQVTPEKQEPLKLKKDGSYIIAGGLGDLGQRVARWMAAHGAGHIVTLSRRTLDDEAHKFFHKELEGLGAELHVMTCDITEISSLEAVAVQCHASCWPVNGIVHAGMVLRDHPLENMTYQDWKISTQPKVQGTLNLDQVFGNKDSLDFFITFSSVTAIVGTQGQANYAAGNAFQDAFAQSKVGSKTRYMSLNLGAVDNTSAITSLPARQQEIMRQGTILMSFEEVYKVLEYAMGPQATEDNCVQLILGFDRRTLVNIQDEINLQNPLFSHIPYIGDKNVTTAGDGSPDSANFLKTLRQATTAEAALEIIIGAVTERIAMFSARPKDEISPEARLTDVGMDSLVAIELKNWATKSFQTSLATAEVVDAYSIAALGATIASRSKIIPKELGGIGGEVGDEGSQVTVPKVVTAAEKKSTMIPNHSYECCHLAKDLPKLPLMDLDSLLQGCLDNNRQFCSDEEFKSLSKAVEETKKPDGVAAQVWAKIAQRAADPETENWIDEWYLKMMYTEKRRTLSPYSNFIGMHPHPKPNEEQAQRAAIITYTAFKCKQGLDAKTWEPLLYLGIPQCTDSWQYLFNTSRYPRTGGDEIVRYPGNDYIAVLHRGHVYKVELAEGGINVPFDKIRATFQLILDTEKIDSWVSILTADERDSWAHWYEVIRSTSDDNDKYLETIRAALFLVCLDDVTPTTAKERVENVILGNGFNRWSDKSIAFVVCRNGASGTYVEHGPIDSLTLTRLQTAISTAITSSDDHPEFQTPIFPGPIALNEYTCTTTPEIDAQIVTVRQKRFETAAKHEYCDVWQNSFGKDLLLSRGYPIKGIFDVLIQLAIFYYFGKNRPVWEAVSMQGFHKGRPDCVQVVSPIISKFCSSADDVTIPVSMRLQLLLDAAYDYNATIKKASTGRFCYLRTLFVMEKIAHDQGLPAPPIIQNEVFQKYNNSEIMPSASDGLSPESGFILDNENFLWMTYYITENASHYSLTSGKNRSEKFAKCLKRAAATIKDLIDGA